MLKKKEWLRRLKQLLSKTEYFDNFTIQELMVGADEGWKQQLSPGEAAEYLISCEEERACFIVSSFFRIPVPVRYVYPW
jgi:hypothetical protein